MILQTAPRDEQALERMIKQRKDRIAETMNVIECEPLYDEIDALEWLLSKVRIKDSYFYRGRFCMLMILP